MTEPGTASAGMDDEHDDTALLLEYLASHDAACPACGYNLRGLTASSCPECGADLRLTVATAETRDWGYTFGLTGLLSSIALAALLAIQQIQFRSLLSIVTVPVGVWLAREALRWRANRRVFAALPMHKKQERLIVCWIPVIVIGGLILGLARPGW